MFSIFQSKPVVRDLLPDNYIDIHSHLLAGIDDGAKSLKDSLQLVKALQDFGTSQIITTPHVMQHFYENSSEDILKIAANTKLELENNSLHLPFRAAAEYMMDENFVKLFQSEPLLTLKDNYVLVEMSYLNPPIQLYSILFELQVAGYTPVLAHPERYVFYHNTLEEYQKLRNAGCLLQLNLLSVTGYYGLGIAKIAEKLLQKGMYSFVGSDIHHKKHLAAFNQKVKLKDISPLKEVIQNNSFFKIE
jgi:protein-tyrosine phosphatase